MEVRLRVEGPDGFALDGTSSMREIARDPADLVAELIGPTHQYPDGAVLYLGTMFAPTKDRGTPGSGFTHKVGDIVTIHAPELGALTNRMVHAERGAALDVRRRRTDAPPQATRGGVTNAPIGVSDRLRASVASTRRWPQCDAGKSSGQVATAALRPTSAAGRLPFSKCHCPM